MIDRPKKTATDANCYQLREWDGGYWTLHVVNLTGKYPVRRLMGAWADYDVAAGVLDEMLPDWFLPTEVNRG